MLGDAQPLAVKLCLLRAVPRLYASRERTCHCVVNVDALAFGGYGGAVPFPLGNVRAPAFAIRLHFGAIPLDLLRVRFDLGLYGLHLRAVDVGQHSNGAYLFAVKSDALLVYVAANARTFDFSAIYLGFSHF